MYAEGACDFQDADTCNGKPSASGVPNNSYTREDDEDATTVDPNFISILEDGESDEEDNLPDLYAILGVAKDANEAEIRAAYRCKSRLVHPDKHAQGSARSNSTTSAPILADADASFGRVVAAYNVLSDPRKRSIYDQFGHRGESDSCFTAAYTLAAFNLLILPRYKRCCGSYFHEFIFFLQVFEFRVGRSLYEKNRHPNYAWSIFS